MREQIWTCDRCKMRGPSGGCHSFDFGNDYSGNWGPEDGSSKKERVIVDLCVVCWEKLCVWLKGEQRT